MFENAILVVNRDVVDTDIRLGAGGNSGNAAMLVFFLRKGDNRVRFQ